MEIKALTLWQPWASLMALEHKKIETRSWKTNYRGLLAIHAAKRKMGTDEKELLRMAVMGAGIDIGIKYDDYPFGEIVAVVDVINISRIDSHSSFYNMMFDIYGGKHESLFGNYAIGRYAWITKIVYAVNDGENYPVQGHQGLWNWEVPEGTKMYEFLENEEQVKC